MTSASQSSLQTKPINALFQNRDDWAFLKSLQGPVSNEDLDRARKIIARPFAAHQPCTEEQFLKYIRILEVNLNARNDDQQTGAIRMRTYYGRLGTYPIEAIKFMAQRCIETMVFFPAVSECLQILNEWKHHASDPKALAKVVLLREMQRRLDDLRVKVRSGTVRQDDIDNAPERWQMILIEEGFLKRDGNSVIRRERIAA